MKIIAFIFARGGSKGVPRKNIKNFNGKPLIAWSIEQALAINRVSKVIVSTDSPEIAAIAKSFGAEVPFIRPAELSGDESSEWLAWQHAINFLKSKGESFDVFLSLPPTSPGRSIEDVGNCLDKYLSQQVDAVITVTESNSNPYFNMVLKNKDGSVSLAMKSEKYIRRQDAPKVFSMTTVAYVANPSWILTSSGIFDGRVDFVEIPKLRGFDIDTPLDFEVGEFLMSKIHNPKKENYD